MTYFEVCQNFRMLRTHYNRSTVIVFWQKNTHKYKDTYFGPRQEWTPLRDSSFVQEVTLTFVVEGVRCADERRRRRSVQATPTSSRETSSTNDAPNRCVVRPGGRPVNARRRPLVLLPPPRHRRRLADGTAPCRRAAGTPTGSSCSSRSRRTGCSSSCSSPASATRPRQPVCAGRTTQPGWCHRLASRCVAATNTARRWQRPLPSSSPSATNEIAAILPFIHDDTSFLHRPVYKETQR